MQRTANYTHSTQSSHHHSTSSAFSASANPDEDWTKISDLAERRRIQNRIAQRNYRKKLKKRLEDLERRAASSSASPEQRPVDLHRSTSSTSSRDGRHTPETSSIGRSTPEPAHPHDQFLPAEDWTLFSHQYTRQMSTSPPPFSYSTYSDSDVSMDSLSQSSGPAGYYSGQIPTSADMLYSSSYYSSAGGHPYSAADMAQQTSAPIKQEYYGGDDVNPFSLSYASMAGLDIAAPHMYQEPGIHVMHPDFVARSSS